MDQRTEAFMQIIGSMAQVGPSVRQELANNVGAEPGPGHRIDAALKLMAIVESCANSGNFDRGIDALSGALFLLRELAISQGYLTPAEKTEA
jgi:hypothetical protein